LRAEATASTSAGLGELATAADPLGEAQHVLLRMRRPWMGTEVSVHDQQVNGVGTNVEDAKSHRCNRIGLRGAGVRKTQRS
jgi:hypothetical protein